MWWSSSSSRKQQLLLACFFWLLVCCGIQPTLAARPHFETAPLVMNLTCRAYYGTKDIITPYQTSHFVVNVDSVSDTSVLLIWETSSLPDFSDETKVGFCNNEKGCDCHKEGELKTPCEHKEILTQHILKPDAEIAYDIPKKGIYCMRIVSQTLNATVEGNIQFYYPYGALPAHLYPYLPFYGIMALIYLVIGIIWAILSGCYWREILDVQIYISGVIFLCMLEMSVYFGYYHNYNITGHDSPYLYDWAVTLNALRFTVSFVCLLVVSMGYGLVKPTLGSTAYRVMLLGVTHFVFNAMFLLNGNNKGSLEFYAAILFVFPLALTLTIFYSWTLKSLTETIKKLELRRQVAKVWSYKWLYRILFASIILLVVLMIIFLARTDFNQYWDTLWLRQASFQWLYFAVFVCIIFLWRPRRNNARYGVEEIPMEDHEEDLSEVVGGNAPTERVSKRKKSIAKTEDDTAAEDDLKWVEENIPDVDYDDSESLIVGSDIDEARLIRQEMSKMN